MFRPLPAMAATVTVIAAVWFRGGFQPAGEGSGLPAGHVHNPVQDTAPADRSQGQSVPEPQVVPEAWVFNAPLISAGGAIVPPEEAKELEQLKSEYISFGGQENIASARKIRGFLQAFPDSAYAVSLLQEQSRIEWRHGYFQDSVVSLRKAWEKGERLQGLTEKRLAEAALAGLLTVLGEFGQKDELRTLITENADRPLGGFAREAMTRAKETLWFLEHKPAENIFCGFTAANDICVPLGKEPIFPDIHDPAEEKVFIADGLSLFELRAHSHEAGGDLRIVKRTDPAAEFPVPCIVHWKFNHYSAITERSGAKYRVKDFHLKFDGWVPADAVTSQASGYVLAPAGTVMPAGFAGISDDEAKSIFGRHCTHGRGSDGGNGGNAGGGGGQPGCVETGTPPGGAPTGGGGATEGGDTTPMANYTFSLLNPGLEIRDTPVSYSPPYGPAVACRLEYDQRSVKTPDIAQHGNFGPRWTFNYTGYIELKGTGAPSTSIDLVFGDGEYISYTLAAGVYASSSEDQPRLEFISAAAGGPGYRVRFSDGQEWHYTKGNGAAATRYYLTARKDPSGNMLSLGYDVAMRLIAITDAGGQVTTFSYAPEAGDQVLSDALKIRAITDPFGRKASFKYTASGQLFRIIDPVGITSEFRYEAGSDFIDRLTTPYGSTAFTWQELPGINEEPGRAIEATDANGDKERAEANDYSNYPSDKGEDPHPAPDSVLVAGQSKLFYPKIENLHYRNTFYWDKLQMKYYPGDYSKARIYNWKAQNDTITGFLSSLVLPLEGRIWFNYPGQTNAEGFGTSRSPSKIVRLVEGPDGAPAWTMEQREYDPAYGKIRRIIDLMGRETVFEYNDASDVPGAVRGLDLTAVKVRRGAGYDVISRFSDFTAHKPGTVIDAAGQKTTFTFNAAGQVLTVRNPRNEITTFSYYDSNAAGRQRKGRISSIDGPLPGAGDTVTLDYDLAGNANTVTGTDGYTLVFQYDALDRLTRVTFPDGTWTGTAFDNLDPKITTDRLGRETRHLFNNLQQLVSVTDPAGRTVQYQWCKCGELRQIIDAMGRVTSWKHDGGGRVTAKVYPDGSAITYAYQPLSGRLSSVTDEKGQIKNLAYNSDGTLASVIYQNPQKPTPNLAFTYDTAYQRLLRMVDGIGTTNYSYHAVTDASAPGAGRLASVDGPWDNDLISYGYDELGRVTSRDINGSAQSFEFDPTGRPKTVKNALGEFTLAYDGATARLGSISHQDGVKTQFSYFKAAGDFRLQRISNLKPNGVPVSVFDYTYDAQGRILTWRQQDDANEAAAKTWTTGYDNADQLTSLAIRPGAATLSTQAWTYDPAGNRTSETLNSATTPFSYNSLNELTLTSAPMPPATYEWDAENRLTAINQGAARTEFSYDGNGRRVRIVEKTNGATDSISTFLWSGLELCERRNDTGSKVQRRYFPEGFEGVTNQSSKTLHTVDHLGSIRELTDTTGMVRERISYSAWGTPAGTSESDFGFTGHFFHARSALHFAPFRAYFSLAGRWISRDPLLEPGANNLFTYTENSPAMRVDPLGLDWIDSTLDWFDSRGPDNFMLGFLDSLAFNTASSTMDFFGLSGGFDKCSGDYKGGQIAGFTYGMAMAAKSLLTNGYKAISVYRPKPGGQYYFRPGSGMRPGAVSAADVRKWRALGIIAVISFNKKTSAAIKTIFSSSKDACGCSGR
ncbi:MAG: hypothetical protein JWM59_2475 [Verrucomicrobiales bacterium]|nr:hypothetical protein [Verrucomicrobiales bacterium]